MEDPLGGPADTMTKTPFTMSDQRNQPGKTTTNNPQDRKPNEQPEARKQSAQPQDKEARTEPSDRNRVGGDASRTQATRPQEPGKTPTQEPHTKTGRH